MRANEAVEDYQVLHRPRQMAARVLHEVANTYQRPAVLCSFGKDSLALLHLTRALGYHWPTVLHRMPGFPEKYAFADHVAREWGIEMQTQEVLRRTLVRGNGRVDIAWHFRRGQDGGEYLIPLANLVDPEEDGATETLCAVEDFLQQPVNADKNRSAQVDWDVIVAGRKAVDTDPVVGHLGLSKDIYLLEHGADMAFPLREWSDADVWRYIEANDVPWHEHRYERCGPGQYRNRDDKTHNPDYVPCCTRCINPARDMRVWCPMLRDVIPNRWEEYEATPVRQEVGGEVVPVYL